MCVRLVSLDFLLPSYSVQIRRRSRALPVDPLYSPTLAHTIIAPSLTSPRFSMTVCSCVSSQAFSLVLSTSLLHSTIKNLHPTECVRICTHHYATTRERFRLQHRRVCYRSLHMYLFIAHFVSEYSCSLISVDVPTTLRGLGKNILPSSPCFRYYPQDPLAVIVRLSSL